ncbi:hypothetical protein RND81_05G091700 [Saponaria officinalis]|uniref:Uncharacterized protein n=1 Tax=Saponaria officinalis TaxID=3572 RepID=A0AAW1KZ15_SAPOF
MSDNKVNDLCYYFSTSSVDAAEITKKNDDYVVKLEVVLPKTTKIVSTIKDHSKLDDTLEDAISIPGVRFMLLKDDELTIIGAMTNEDITSELENLGQIQLLGTLDLKS